MLTQVIRHSPTIFLVSQLSYTPKSRTELSQVPQNHKRRTDETGNGFDTERGLFEKSLIFFFIGNK